MNIGEEAAEEIVFRGDRPHGGKAPLVTNRSENTGMNIFLF
jgi:hypothetical protein